MTLAKNESDLEVKELAKWQKLEESGIKTTLKRFIGKEEVVSKQELMQIWNCNARTIERYVKDGMPLHEASEKRFQIFEINKCLEWRDGTVDKTMSMKTKKPSVVDHKENIAEEQVRERSDIARKFTADADDAELKAELNRIKLEEARGKLVKAEDVDKAMAEISTIYISNYRFDKKLLPVECENRDKAEISKILVKHYAKRVEELQQFLSKHWDTEETLFDIVDSAVYLMRNGISAKEIIQSIEAKKTKEE